MPCLDGFFREQAQHREPQISFANAAQKTSEAVASSVDKVKNAAQSPGTIAPIVAVIAVVFIIACIVWWFFIRDGSGGGGVPFDVVDVGSNEAGIPASDSIVLTAVATDTAWLSITMDSSRTQQTLLVPDEEYRWSAMTLFVVSIGNAGSVQFFRNGSPLPIFGKSGEALREIKISRKDVTASNTSFKAPTQMSTKPQTAVTPAKIASPPAKSVSPPMKNPGVQVSKKPPVAAQRKLAPPVRTKAEVEAQRRKIDRDLITPAPPQPIRR